MNELLLKDSPSHFGEWAGLDDDKFVNFVRSLLLKMPIFERLVYLASLAGSGTRSLCDQFNQRFPEANYDSGKADAAIAHQHEAVFEEWLALSVERKLAGLEYWASHVGTPRVDLACEWLQGRSQDRLVPRRALGSQTLLFRSDMALLLPIIFVWGS